MATRTHTNAKHAKVEGTSRYHTHKHTQTHKHTHTQTHPHPHTHIHTDTHPHTNTPTQQHTHKDQHTNTTPIQFNSIQFYLYSAITIQLSLGALQSPEPETPLVQAQWQQGQGKTPGRKLKQNHGQ